MLAGGSKLAADKDKDDKPQVTAAAPAGQRFI